MTDDGGPGDTELDSVRAAMAAGDYLAAFDLAESLTDLGGLAGLEARYLSVLALARAGSPERAIDRFAAFGLGVAANDPGVPAALAQDIAALEARVAKDRALAVSGPLRKELAAKAAARYEAVHARFASGYTSVNAATLWLLAGDSERAEGLARVAAAEVAPLIDRDSEADTNEAPEFWTLATGAEAALIVGDLARTTDLLSRAAACSVGEHAKRAVCRRQLLLVCELLGTDPALLDSLRNPTVIHFCGHRASPLYGSGRFPAEAEADVMDAIRAVLAERNVGFGFGSLASGADICFAEALHERGAEVHVVLPFGSDEFIAASVEDGGDQWVQRFHTCLQQATSVRVAAHADYLADDSLFGFGARVAMGDAVNRAAFLATDVEQLAVWDGGGGPSGDAGPAGTAHDVEAWRAAGRTTVVIPIPDTTSAPAAVGAPAGATALPGPAAGAAMDPGLDLRREVRAMLFTDMAGFGKLSDAQTGPFMEQVMGSLARTINRFGDEVLQRQTWGDAIYLVFADVDAAARCALALQDTMASLDLAALGLDPLRGMRIAAHVGPVFRGRDRVRDEVAFFGTTVVRAARIEPRTPEGEVYVTHPFAALATLEPRRPYRCHYVGQVPTAKEYGSLPMYLLRPT